VDDRSRPNPRARPSWSSPGAALCDGGVLTAAVTRWRCGSRPPMPTARSPASD